MVKPLLLLAVGLLGGCAPTIKTYRYDDLGFQVKASDRNTVDNKCREKVKKNDYGNDIAWNSRIAGCFLPSQFDLDELWVSIEDGLFILIHELCHASGIDKEDCVRKYSK